MNTKSILIAGALLVFGAYAASAEGINLSWDDCGTTGTLNKTFACNTNTGLNTAIASFDPPPGIDQLTTITAQVDINTALALPEWWKHGGTFCRGTNGLGVSFDFSTGPFGPCIDLYAGTMSGTFDYNVGFGNPNRARLRLLGSAALENAAVVTPGTEYYAFKLNLLRSKTTGTGSCAGCTESACIVLNEIRMVEPEGVGSDPTIYNPRDRSFVTWQSPASGPPGCPLSTPTQSRTWGQMKSLYR